MYLVVWGWALTGSMSWHGRNMSAKCPGRGGHPPGAWFRHPLGRDANFQARNGHRPLNHVETMRLDGRDGWP